MDERALLTVINFVYFAHFEFATFRHGKIKISSQIAASYIIFNFIDNFRD